MHLQKYMIIAYATGPPTSAMTISSLLHQQTSIGNLQSLDRSTLRDEHSARCKGEQNTGLSKSDTGEA